MALNIQSSATLSRFTGSKADILGLEGSNSVTIGKWYYTNDHLADAGIPLEVYYGIKSNKLSKVLTASDVAQIAIANNYVKSVAATLSATPNVDANGVLRVNVNLSTQAGQRAVETADGLLVTESLDYVRSTGDTDTMMLPVDANGKLTAFLRTSGAAGNALQVKPDGAFVQATTVHADSVNYLQIVDGAIKVKAAATIEKHNATALPSLAEFVSDLNTQKYVPTTPIEIGDIVLFAPAIGNFMYIGNGVAPYVEADFVKFEGPGMDDSYIRSRFLAGQGIAYNPLTGEIKTRVSADAGNDLAHGSDGGNFVSVASASFVATNGATPLTNTTQEHITNVHTRINDLTASVVNGAENGVSVVGQKARLGGALLVDTIIDQATKELSFKGNGATMVQNLYNAAYEVDANGLPVGDAKGWVRTFVGLDADGSPEWRFLIPSSWNGINNVFDKAAFGSHHS